MYHEAVLYENLPVGIAYLLDDGPRSTTVCAEVDLSWIVAREVGGIRAKGRA
jgi:hypothetical protein